MGPTCHPLSSSSLHTCCKASGGRHRRKGAHSGREDASEECAPREGGCWRGGVCLARLGAGWGRGIPWPGNSCGMACRGGAAVPDTDAAPGSSLAAMLGSSKVVTPSGQGRPSRQDRAVPSGLALPAKVGYAAMEDGQSRGEERVQ